MTTKFRKLRISCGITLKEIADIVNISHQRLSQIELRRFGTYPKNQERLVEALETAIRHKRREIERAEYICQNERKTLFDFIK